MKQNERKIGGNIFPKLPLILLTLQIVTMEIISKIKLSKTIVPAMTINIDSMVT